MRQHRGEAEAHVEFGLNGAPAGFIIHGHRSELSWLVWEVLGKWAMPYPERPGPGSHAEVDRFRLRVGGPLPGRPAEYGNFVMIVRRYADDPPGAWWISAGPRAAAGMSVPARNVGSGSTRPPASEPDRPRRAGDEDKGPSDSRDDL